MYSFNDTCMQALPSGEPVALRHSSVFSSSLSAGSYVHTYSYECPNSTIGLHCESQSLQYPTPTPAQRTRWVEGWHSSRWSPYILPQNPPGNIRFSDSWLDCRMSHSQWTGAGSASLRSVVQEGPRHLRTPMFLMSSLSRKTWVAT